MDNIKNLIEELKTLGFNQEQITEVMQLGEEEIVDIVLEDFAFNAPEEKVKEYSETVSQLKGNPEKFAQTFNEIMAIHYGAENVEKKKEELLTEYLQNIINLTKQTKEVKEKYEQGDPETVKAVQEAQNSPLIQDMAKKMDEENPDSQDNG